jgi:hypothetical protein
MSVLYLKEVPVHTKFLLKETVSSLLNTPDLSNPSLKHQTSMLLERINDVPGARESESPDACGTTSADIYLFAHPRKRRTPRQY